MNSYGELGIGSWKLCSATLSEKLFFFFTSPVEPNDNDDVIEMWLNPL